jgi:hypothetical protein
MVRSLRLLCLLSANLLVCSALSTFTPASALSSQPAALSICGAERPAVVLMAAASASEPVRSAEMALLHVHLFNFLLKVPHFVAYDCNACLCAWLWSLSDPSGDYQCRQSDAPRQEERKRLQAKVSASCLHDTSVIWVQAGQEAGQLRQAPS